MRIGEFTTLLNITKHSVRHYEDLDLLSPKWKGNYKDYGEKDILDYQVIIELKELGLNLKDIQLLFTLKKAFGCGDKQFVNQVFNQLTNHVELLLKEEDEIHKRRIRLQNEMNKIRELL